MRLIKRDIGLFAFVGVALIILLFGLDLIPSPFARGGPTQAFLPTAVTPVPSSDQSYELVATPNSGTVWVASAYLSPA